MNINATLSGAVACIQIKSDNSNDGSEMLIDFETTVKRCDAVEIPLKEKAA